MSATSPAHRRGIRDFHLRKFENPYPAGAARQALHAGFREAAQLYRAAVRARHIRSDDQQRAVS